MAAKLFLTAGVMSRVSALAAYHLSSQFKSDNSSSPSQQSAAPSMTPSIIGSSSPPSITIASPFSTTVCPSLSTLSSLRPKATEKVGAPRITYLPSTSSFRSAVDQASPYDSGIFVDQKEAMAFRPMSHSLSPSGTTSPTSPRPPRSSFHQPSFPMNTVTASLSKQQLDVVVARRAYSSMVLAGSATIMKGHKDTVSHAGNAENEVSFNNAFSRLMMSALPLAKKSYESLATTAVIKSSISSCAEAVSNEASSHDDAVCDQLAPSEDVIANSVEDSLALTSTISVVTDTSDVTIASDDPLSDSDERTILDDDTTNPLPSPRPCSRSGYRLCAAAACQGKRNTSVFVEGRPSLWQSPEMPEFCKVDCGEDAFFHTDTLDYSVLGVADGVGGWQALKVNPALFAWALMTASKSISEFTLSQMTDVPTEAISMSDDDKNCRMSLSIPGFILGEAYRSVVEQELVWAGSSTACILSLSSVTGVLQSANLGDSGFLLIRSRQIVYRSCEQQHSFNTPYQLSIIPEIFNKYSNIVNQPSDAHLDEIITHPGDIIIVGTDGLWDNLFDEEILQIVLSYGDKATHSAEYTSQSEKMMNDLAERLVLEARRLSTDRDRISPFAKAALASGKRYKGGKMDDITVLAACISYHSESSPDIPWTIPPPQQLDMAVCEKLNALLPMPSHSGAKKNWRKGHFLSRSFDSLIRSHHVGLDRQFATAMSDDSVPHKPFSNNLSPDLQFVTIKSEDNVEEEDVILVGSARSDCGSPQPVPSPTIPRMSASTLSSSSLSTSSILHIQSSREEHHCSSNSQNLSRRQHHASSRRNRRASLPTRLPRSPHQSPLLTSSLAHPLVV